MTTTPHDPVDFEVLNGLAEAQGDGEPDLIVELIDLYLADTPPRLAAMQSAWVNSDGLSLGRGAHALKGSSSTLGASQVTESCAEIELLSREGALPQVAAVLNRLEQELGLLRKTLLVERQGRTRTVEAT